MTFQNIILEDLLYHLSPVATCYGTPHLCSSHGITVVDYKDKATRDNERKNKKNGGQFTEVVLHPTVIITDHSQIEKANELHKEANKMCFIGNSCNFPIRHVAICRVEEK